MVKNSEGIPKTHVKKKEDAKRRKKKYVTKVKKMKQEDSDGYEKIKIMRNRSQRKYRRKKSVKNKPERALKRFKRIIRELLSYSRDSRLRQIKDIFNSGEDVDYWIKMYRGSEYDYSADTVDLIVEFIELCKTHKFFVNSKTSCVVTLTMNGDQVRVPFVKKYPNNRMIDLFCDTAIMIDGKTLYHGCIVDLRPPTTWKEEKYEIISINSKKNVRRSVMDLKYFLKSYTLSVHNVEQLFK